MNEKKRLFVDMDGTLAVFTPVKELETLYQKGYFYNLEPIQNVVSAIKNIIKNSSEIDVYILSAVLSDSSYAENEKNQWLDKYLPEIPHEKRIFLPCGDDKKNYIPHGVRITDFLLDDYTKNLSEWQPPARGIKLLNGINHTNGSWEGDRIRFNRDPVELTQKILNVIYEKEQVYDDKNFIEKKSLNEFETEIRNSKDGSSKAKTKGIKVPEK